MKLVSFNLNGIRARIHQLETLIKKHEPDIIGLQETKVQDDLFPHDYINTLGYHSFYHGEKRHYGVAILTKIHPIKIFKGFPAEEENVQRRLITIEISSNIGNIIVINGYFPQGENRNNKIKFTKKKDFFYDLKNYLIQRLEKNKLIIIMGDMNISYNDIDIGIGEKNRQRWLRIGKCSFLPEEREWMNNLLQLGFIDTWRNHHPHINNCFSWFDYRSKGFIENRGLRVDLLLASEKLAAYCIDSGIDYDIRGMMKPSDHAPIWAVFNI
ncbi:MAG: exodeoxyribonuclease III [Pantoea sp. Brub]|nr:exodeoxyribonuclease III [Pantoea sp. Brub]